ncbi:hypothetical protein OCA8868_03103 [Octadecabacter ascidiaceicola]|uniref:Uncharacterized protein n=1 Tax=Octadecabacter ascidiaceicola TaxID=1655543 RepID=A0A238KNK1_9RHOB|nr:hypothetical protein OCA8868_03103 [Octadecabacter ascidiaceicola]
MFLKNAWCVAAWDHEVTRDLQQIVVLGEKFVRFERKLANSSRLRVRARIANCLCPTVASRAAQLSVAIMG